MSPGFVAVPLGIFSTVGMTPTMLSGNFNSAAARMVPRTLAAPQYLTLWGLFDYIHYLKQNEQNSLQYEQALWAKLVNPFIIVFMIILSIPLVRSNSRTIVVGQRVFIGCLAGIIFHLCNQIAGHLGVVYEINPALSATFPAMLLSAMVFWLLHRHV